MLGRRHNSAEISNHTQKTCYAAEHPAPRGTPPAGRPIIPRGTPGKGRGTPGRPQGEGGGLAPRQGGRYTASAQEAGSTREADQKGGHNGNTL